MSRLKVKHLFLVFGIAMSVQVLSAAPEPQGHIQYPINDQGWDNGSGGTGTADQCVEACHQGYLGCMAVAQTNDDAANCSISFTTCVNTNC